MGFALVVSSVVLYFVALQMLIQACNACTEKERMGLLEIKAHFIAQNSDFPISELSSWVDDRANNCCSWKRIKCNNISTGHVIELDLSQPYNDTEKTSLMLNVSLFRPFEELLSLDLSGNHYEGWIHNERFPRLKKLESLNLSENSLNSSILSSLNGLTSLKTLNLGFNSMNPFSAQEFARVKKLEVLDLSRNYLNMSILSALNGFTSLRSLNLENNYIDGPFPTQDLAKFNRLELLDLSTNFLSGSLHVEGLQNLRNLKVLDLSQNYLNSSIEGLQNLRNLKVLDLSQNYLNDSIEGLQNLMNLKVLDLSLNYLNGSIEGLQNLRNLKVLDLSLNYLNGSIEGLCRMKDLIELGLHGNEFSGQIPECLSMLKDLLVLDLSQNLFSGNFPSCTSNMTSLVYLSLSDNYLQGSFSMSTLANHSKLQFLYISPQGPKAQVDTENMVWFPTFQLKHLILQSCNINMGKGSTIPSFLLYQKDLEYIDLSHNKLVGAFPSWLIQNNSRLETFFLMSNSFVGTLQLSIIRQGIFRLDISNNNISGLLPKDIGTFLPRIVHLNLSRNNFEGNIPASIGKMQSLSTLDLCDNHFSGEIPQQLATKFSSIQILRLSNNLLQGNIVNLSALPYLYELSISNNNISGTIKQVLANLSHITLGILDISKNSISGEIPSSIDKLSWLKVLLMAENQLEGKVPLEFSTLAMLYMLDLSQNRLFGSVSCINLSSMTYLYLQKNNFSGSIIPDSDTLFEGSQLEILDLRNNNFSGNIPYWMHRLPNLRVILLGGNNFYGQIPIQFCRLKNITIMDLSHNKINGSIPSCFMSFGMTQKDYDHTGTGFGFGLDGPSSASTNSHYGHVSVFDHTNDIPLDEKKLATAEFRTKGNYYSYRGNALEYMTGMDLSCNMLTGIIPPEIGNLQQIHALNLSHNLLSGFIPSTFSNLTQIESLDLSYNNLSGEIPSQLNQLNFLSIFNVSYNNLSGTPPSTGQFQDFDEDNYKGNPALCGPLLKRKCVGAVPPSSQSNTIKEVETTLDMVAFYWSFCASYIIFLLGIIMVLCINARWRMTWFYYISKLTCKCFPSFLCIEE